MIRALIFHALLLLGALATAQDPLIWGSLKPGAYSVGCRSLIKFDETRQYDPDYMAGSNKTNPRPIFIAMWYPAKKTAANRLDYREYLEVKSDDARAASFAQRLRFNFREVVSDETVGKVPAKSNKEEAAAFDRLLATKTIATKNAPVAAGRFPVLIYHPGLDGTPEENSAMFEYLASHGYVILSSVYQDADGYSVNCGGGGLRCTYGDLEFLSRYSRSLTFVDPDQLIAMGHSYGAWAIITWAAQEDAALRAFVSLDSGLEYDTIETSGSESLQYQMKENRVNARAASLRAASQERKADFTNLDPYLKFTDRYEADARGLVHDDFVTHGAMRPALLPTKWPDPTGERRLSYDRICMHVLYFLDATIKGRADAKEALKRSVRGEGLDARFTFGYKPANPRPPSPRQVSLYVRQNGVESAIALMKTFGQDSLSMFAAAHVLFEDGEVRRRS